MKRLLVFLALMVPTVASAANFVGQVQLPATYDGFLGSYSASNISPALSVNWKNYAGFITSGQNIYARMCVSWTDNGTYSNGLQLLLFDRVKGYFSSSFATTWSGRQLHNIECGSTWILVYSNGANQICGDGWGGECYVQARYYSPEKSGELVTINSVWLELWAW